MLTTSPRVPEVSLEEVEARPSDAVVLDVREPEEYAKSHIPGAVNLPQAELATRLNEVPQDHPVYVVCLAGMRSLRASQFLAQRGYTNIASMAGGTDAWIEAGKPVATGEVYDTAPNYVESLWSHGGGYSYEI
jgi:rhodanese-related sulfurtransferase